MRRRSVKALLTTAVIASLLMTPTSFAGSSGNSVVTAGHPGTLLFGVTESEFFLQKRCSGVPVSQGVDGIVVNVAGESRFQVLGNSVAPYSLNVTFYSPSCLLTQVNQTGVRNGQLFTQTSWSGAIPGNTKWAVVSVAYGANVNLSWSTCTPSQFVSCSY